jgi:hypothetical protein
MTRQAREGPAAVEAAREPQKVRVLRIDPQTTKKANVAQRTAGGAA